MKRYVLKHLLTGHYVCRNSSILLTDELDNALKFESIDGYQQYVEDTKREYRADIRNMVERANLDPKTRKILNPQISHFRALKTEFDNLIDESKLVQIELKEVTKNG